MIFGVFCAASNENFGCQGMFHSSLHTEFSLRKNWNFLQIEPKVYLDMCCYFAQAVLRFVPLFCGLFLSIPCFRQLFRRRRHSIYMYIIFARNLPCHPSPHMRRPDHVMGSSLGFIFAAAERSNERKFDCKLFREKIAWYGGRQGASQRSPF